MWYRPNLSCDFWCNFHSLYTAPLKWRVTITLVLVKLFRWNSTMQVDAKIRVVTYKKNPHTRHSNLALVSCSMPDKHLSNKNQLDTKMTTYDTTALSSCMQVSYIMSSHIVSCPDYFLLSGKIVCLGSKSQWRYVNWIVNSKTLQ